MRAAEMQAVLEVAARLQARRWQNWQTVADACRKVAVRVLDQLVEDSLPTPAARAACAALPRYIVAASDWLRAIWDEREKFAAKPALLLWGHRDIAFRRKELDTWRAALHAYELHEFPDRGHFLAEEAPGEIAPLLRRFLSGDAGSDA